MTEFLSVNYPELFWLLGKLFNIANSIETTVYYKHAFQIGLDTFVQLQQKQH